MALVAYDNSDGSDYEDDENETHVITPATSLNQALQGLPPKISNVVDQKDPDDDQSLFIELPKPTNQKTLVKEEDDEFLHKKATISEVAKPKSRITVPSLNDFKDVEDTVPSVRPKPTNGKSGLLSILPQPKNGTSISTKMLVPQSVSNKPQTASVKKKGPLPSPMKKAKVETKNLLLADYSDDSDEDIQNDFFSIHKAVELPPADTPLDIDIVSSEVESSSQKEPRSIESYFKKEEHVELEPDFVEPEYDVNPDAYQSVDDSNDTNNEAVLDEEAILKLCGTRGKRKREEIQIVDVNQQEVLKDAREMLLRGLMDDTTKRQSHSKKRGNEPTSQQKRKHQITYLAHQAKANEAELQNQWANNRMTKRQTQSKYGF
ncbi:proline-rich protein PRCC isoform X2 [Zerene cesonia]|uniref:proline-rich protein PRCC isoform X2 n=1 Tax=Zerene cesonia TaxID=33412 RepID=UPI0018E595BB|nr:proline-rich protein PRCC isoform X2 [Zerene cesonia]